jgi:hypothetical protein
MESEIQLQARCFQWHWNTFPSERGMLFHVDNNSGNSITGNIKKAQGVVSGSPDLILVVPQIVYFIEMKTETGVLSDKQKEFRNKAFDRGHTYVVIRKFEEFTKLIKSIYEQSLGSA